MSPARSDPAPEPSRRLRHPALKPDAGCPPEQAQLTDQQRVAVVLQGAALLAHFEHGGWYLPDRWNEIRITAAGLLRVGPVERGRASELAQVILTRLVRRLFRTKGEVAGRGEARRAARCLLERWQQILAPSVPDRVVAEIFETAPFLWQPAFGEARVALVAEHGAARHSHLWVAGPGEARRRLLAHSGDRLKLEALLRGPEAFDVWEGWREDVDPEKLADMGHWRRAVAIWRRRPPRTRQDGLIYARCLFALGRYARTLEALKGHSSFEARLLRIRAQIDLGELIAAHGTLRRLETADLTAEQVVELAEVAVRLLAARNQHDGIREWVARSLRAARGCADGRVRRRASLVAAAAAWDLEDHAAMDRHLTDSHDALDDPEMAWRWHHVRGLRAIAAGDGPGVLDHVTAALRHRRRHLLRAEAGRLWNDLAVGRVLVSDLPGAERACRHALRLLGSCEGPSRITLALYNLAEVRLRRGRVAGVERILEGSTAENRRAGNPRGLIRDLELWVRFELVQGRCAAALARCGEAMRQIERTELSSRRPVFELYAARAHGWLGRRDLARACLERVTPQTLGELEPEERPAVWALAGRLDQAADEAAGTPWAGLWSALVAGIHPSSELWGELRHLEPFRAARLVFDCELASSGIVPPARVRQAIATLRRSGADALAEMLENRALSPWQALERYLENPTYEGVAEVLATAGYEDVFLSWMRDGHEKILVPGGGGPEELSAPAYEGRLLLRAPHVDSVLRTVFAVIRRDFQPPRDVARRSRRPAATDGMIGESPLLKQALIRLEQLARGDYPMLILGESGTGKELAARQAHRQSGRSQGPFLAINCAAMSETLIQSDLFGHVRGSFTGADRDRPGVFESARGGTVFLDEIGDLPLAAQGKLLRVLQEGEIRRIGESFARKVDVRVVAATHRDLEQMVSKGEFRQDLFFRLKVATIRLPPLRERGRDVMLLADFLLGRCSGAGPTPKLSASARARLVSHPWPGNIRELRNVLEVAATLANGTEIQPEDLDLPPQNITSGGDYHLLVEAYRRQLVSEALTASGGNRAEAARRLGLTRQALSYLVRQLGLS